MDDKKLVGIGEIADLYNVSKSTVSYWSKQSSFPEPAVRFKMGPAWDVEDVIAWRTPKPRQALVISLTCQACGSDQLKLDRADIWEVEDPGHLCGVICKTCEQVHTFLLSARGTEIVVELDTNNHLIKEDA